MTTPNLPGLDQLVKPFKFDAQPYEYKVVSLRECPTPETLQLCDTPDKAAQYWRLHLPTNPYFNPDCECFVVLLLNTRRRVKGHQIVSFGTQDTLLVHPLPVFRLAVMHNHPSGDPSNTTSHARIERFARPSFFLQRWASCRTRPAPKECILWTPSVFTDEALPSTRQDFAARQPPSPPHPQHY